MIYTRRRRLPARSVSPEQQVVNLCNQAETLVLAYCGLEQYNHLKHLRSIGMHDYAVAQAAYRFLFDRLHLVGFDAPVVTPDTFLVLENNTNE